MKKLMAIIFSILFLLSVTGMCFAQSAPAPAATDKKVEDKAVDKKLDKKRKEG